MLDAVLRDALRRGFLPYEELNPPEDGALAQVVCRYCREGFDPHARLLQREHRAAHRRDGSPLVRLRGRRRRLTRRERYAMLRTMGTVLARDLRRAARKREGVRRRSSR